MPDTDDAQAARWARREPLMHLLGRLTRGVLLDAERELLAAAVRTEVEDGDQAHQRADGRAEAAAEWKEHAVRRRERAEAAEQKLSESETLGHRLLQRAEKAEEQLTAERSAHEKHRQQIAAALGKRGGPGTVPQTWDLLTEHATDAHKWATDGALGHTPATVRAKEHAAEAQAAFQRAQAERERLAAALAELQRVSGARQKEIADALGCPADTPWPDLIRGIRTAASIARKSFGDDQPAERCCVCGDTNVIYRSFEGEPFCLDCAECACGETPCTRTGINDPAVSAQAADERPGVGLPLFGQCSGCGATTVRCDAHGIFRCLRCDTAEQATDAMRAYATAVAPLLLFVRALRDALTPPGPQ